MKLKLRLKNVLIYLPFLTCLSYNWINFAQILSVAQINDKLTKIKQKCKQVYIIYINPLTDSVSLLFPCFVHTHGNPGAGNSIPIPYSRLY